MTETPTLKLGVVAPLPKGPEAALQEVHELGLPTCQITCWKPELFTNEMADRLVAASERYGVEVTTIWAGGPGPAVWDFIEGPTTIGLVPEAYRAERNSSPPRPRSETRRHGPSTA